MEYVKINSLWKRQGWYFEEGKKNNPEYQKGRQSFIIGDYSEPEFGNVKKWRVDEKVDGTNIRIIYQDGKVRFGGRTKDAQIPCHLLDYLQKNFGDWNFSRVFPCEQNQNYPHVILFGEGYGSKIQAVGGNYREDAGFILFDVWIDGWWLKRDDAKEIANKFGIEVVPHIGIMTEEEIVNFVKSKPLSQCSRIPQMIEGVVCRSEPLTLFRNGKPIMFKLKCKEFN
jgi:ATP-dependent RNA circularization protein (DNA/RNA ligase family)